MRLRFTLLLMECPKWSNPIIRINSLNCAPMKVIRKMPTEEKSICSTRENWPCLTNWILGLFFLEIKIAGERMPCLTYMLAFESLEERTTTGDSFSIIPRTKLSDPAYKDSCCSSITRAFLIALPYSQL